MTGCSSLSSKPRAGVSVPAATRNAAWPIELWLCTEAPEESQQCEKGSDNEADRCAALLSCDFLLLSKRAQMSPSTRSSASIFFFF